MCEMVVAPEVPPARTGLVTVPTTARPAPAEVTAVWNTLVKVVTVDAEPLLVTVEDSVTAVPAIAVVGVVLLGVRLIPAGAETVISVHAEQLLLSFDSAMVPAIDALLSAHTRIYFVPDIGKVYESVAAPDAPTARAPLV